VASVNYTTNTLTLGSAANVSDDDPVHVLATYSSQTGLYTNRLSGSLPDIGPYEYGGVSATVPDTTINVSPAIGSTQMQPPLLTWRKVSGATKYWLSVTSDGWSHESWYYTTSNTDTTKRVSGLPASTRIDWNVAAGNDAGYSAFNAAWYYYTAAEQPTTNDTLSWNTVFHFVTLSADKKIYFKDVMRRDIAVMVRMPAAYNLTFDSAIKWPSSGAPSIASGTTVLLGFYRYGLTVFGVLLGTYEY
jgi:hypothetical protein